MRSRSFFENLLKKTLFLTPLMLLLAFGWWIAISARGLAHWGGATAPSHSHEGLSGNSIGGAMTPLSDIPCTAGLAGPFPCHNVDLLSYLPANLFGGFTAADIWGWTDPITGREYAIVSHSMNTTFVDVSDPTNPVFIGELPAPVPNVLWRDVKVYKDHAFIVGDGDFVLPHGLQIFDLTQLRNPAVTPTVFSSTARYTQFGHAHNIAINEETGVGYVVGSNRCSGGLNMLDLQNPTNPAFLGCFSADGYTHDVECVVYRGPDVEHQGKEICFASNEDTLTIVDVTNKSSSLMLARQSYVGSGYTHQGWLTEDQKYFILGDELDEQNDGHNTYSYLWDVSDLDAPVHFSTYVGPTTAIDHNLFILGDFVFESNYTAGLRILNASDIANGILSEVAYFDTHPASDVAEFAGTWSNYPFFESGIVIVSNIEDGLYVLQPHLTSTAPEGAKTTGGGWLAGGDGGKINFSFSVEQTGDGPTGDLRLNDKAAGVKIDLTGVTATYAGGLSCRGLTPGQSVIEFSGQGAFNGRQASFRACAADNGNPGAGNDLFYLECTEGCTYDTASAAQDNILDGGNIQVTLESGDGGSSSDPEATTMILDPLLLSKGLAGQLQTFNVTVYDQNQEPMANAWVTLTRTAADGSVESLTAFTGLTGAAVFSTLNLSQTVETIATSGSAQSNAIELTPIQE